LKSFPKKFEKCSKLKKWPKIFENITTYFEDFEIMKICPKNLTNSVNVPKTFKIFQKI
jgi:hypothetical protein